MKIMLTYSVKLLFLLLLVSLVPLVMLSTIFYVDKIESELDSIEHQINHISKTNAENISNKISEQKRNVVSISQHERIVTPTKELSDKTLEKYDIFRNHYELENQFNIFSNSFPEIQNFIISDAKNGEVLFYTDLTPPSNNLQSQKHFLDAINQGIVSSELLLSENAIPDEFGNYKFNIPTLFISSPIQGEAGVEGILTVRIDFFKTISMSQSDDFVTLDSYLVNSEGYFISKPKYLDELINSNFINTRPELNYKVTNPNTNQLTEIFKISTNETTELHFDGYENYLGKSVIGSISPVKGTNWNYIVEIEKNEACLPITSFQILIFSVLGIVMISMTGLAFYFTSTFTSPLKKLQNATEQIIQGNLDVKTAIPSQDDIGHLARNFQNMVESLKDTTDLKKQITIQQNLRTALEESSIVSIIDPNGKITYVNDKFCQVSKYSKDELIGKRQDLLRTPSIHSPTFYRDLWTVISNGNIWHGEICNTAKDGTLFWCDTTVVPFLDKYGKILEYVSIRVDITEQKNLTERLIRSERLSAIGELSARISHDIRNPLSIIKTEIDLLKHTNVIEENSFNRINVSIDRITHQLNDVLEYLRNSPIDKSRFNLSDTLTEVIGNLKVPSNIKINISGDEIFMIGDKNKFNVVLTNMIFNSIQALEDSGGTIEITLTKTDADIVIQIQDSGAGIDIKPLEAIFEPLTTSKQKGTGLGLASVKNIVEQHDGTISVKSNPTTFTIKIPQNEDVSH